MRHKSLLVLGTLPIPRLTFKNIRGTKSICDSSPFLLLDFNCAGFPCSRVHWKEHQEKLIFYVTIHPIYVYGVEMDFST